MRWYGALAFTALVFVSTGAMAQPGAEAPPPESRIQAGIAFLKANQTANNLNAMFEAMAPQEKVQLKRAVPSLNDAAINAILEKVHSIIIGRQDEMLRLYAIEYARLFTEQELKDLTAFYESDLGRKYIAAVPTLVKETTPVMIRWLQGVMAQELPSIVKALPPQEKKA